MIWTEPLDYKGVDKNPASYGKGLYHQRNQLIASIIKEINPSFIFEIACSYGYLGLEIAKVSDAHYRASNFSQEVVIYTNKQGIECGLYDARTWLNMFYDAYICTSLEHIEDDIGLLRRIPNGAWGIFCVPNFESKGHFRYFEDQRDVVDRYGKYIDDMVVCGVKKGKNKKFIFYGKLNQNKGEE